jgi:hypothetical protein
MRFNLDQLEPLLALFREKKVEYPWLMYMSLETMTSLPQTYYHLHCGTSYYRGIRLIIFDDDDMNTLKKEDREFFEKQGIETSPIAGEKDVGKMRT